MKIPCAFAIIFGLILTAPCTWAAAELSALEGAQLSEIQKLSIAEKQFDIARLLIKEGLFDRVLPEMRKILDLNLQGEHEQLVAESASLLAHLLTENKQYPLGHELLDETISRMKSVDNIASLLKIKAYVYKSEGKLRKARETLERAVEMESQRALP
jgi:tetratricopeptide (TPR) repeat protein